MAGLLSNLYALQSCILSLTTGTSIIHEKDENLVGLRYFQFLLPDINQSLRNYNVLQISDRVLSLKKTITLQRNGKDNTKKVHHRVLGQGSLGGSKRIVNEG